MQCHANMQEALMDYVQSEGQLRIARDSKQLNLASKHSLINFWRLDAVLVMLIRYYWVYQVQCERM